MPDRCIILILFLSIFSASVTAQELQAKVSINSSQVASTVDKKVFQTLQGALTTFLNGTKWTDDVFQQSERINCNFLLTIGKAEDNVFTFTMIVQAARPVFNSNYSTPLINFQDAPNVFKYVEFQPIEFNENRVAGTDGLASNLTATLAYYVYIILGLDYNSFSLKGGEPWFQKAQNIVNNAPDGREITGWRAFDGQRSRYWLATNLTDSKFSVMHDAMYNYYRKGMDFMYENEPEARKSLLECITQLTTLNNDQPHSMLIPFFFQGKATEISKAFKKAPPDEKQRVQEMMMRLDITNANLYKQELK
jgi:Domain of unknown function (DUF4835)